MAPNNIKGNLIIEDAEIIFRNFAGRESDFNKAGQRNFCVFIPENLVKSLAEDGWNLKETKVREEGDTPRTYVEVTLNYNKGRPPRCVMVTSKGRQDLGADEIEMFDWVDIKKVDLIINPYAWEVNGNSGIKAYLKSIFVTIDEDALELKYADVQQVPGSTDETEEEAA